MRESDRSRWRRDRAHVLPFDRKKDDRGQPMMTVHRDISPQNILISFEGDVKLTDFGIAKAASKATVTEVGALRGKLLYMSPEQAWGKPMDRRSDLFSLGIVFYEMVTDHKPFLGSSEVSILETVRECKVAPPSRLNREVPPSLERVVMKALDRDPERRYQDAAEMYRDLEAVLHETPPPPTAATLAHFMETLYEPPEREATVVDEAHEPAAGAPPRGDEAPGDVVVHGAPRRAARLLKSSIRGTIGSVSVVMVNDWMPELAHQRWKAAARAPQRAIWHSTCPAR